MSALSGPPCLGEHLTPLLTVAPHASAVAIVAIRGTEQTLLCGGHEARGGNTATTADTRFELGSVTKTFTALLLADMVAKGEVRYDDPITAYLPRQATPPFGHDAPITLIQLATHTSGLPRLPPGMLRVGLPKWFSNPYADFTEEHLHRSVARCRIRTSRRNRVHYSNFGVGLLGHVLAIAADLDYPSLVATRICDPLGLNRTTCDPDQAQAVGYFHGRPRPTWRIPGLLAAGALRSSAQDLQRYLQAHLSPDTTALPHALYDMRQARVTKPRSKDQLSLVWNLRSYETYDLLFHSGATRGFTSFIGFSPQTQTGLAALTNTTPTLRSHFIQDAYTALKKMINDH
ncbi:MAG: serine hydrolase domain-containing protein [Pseudonocardiales bacterium]